MKSFNSNYTKSIIDMSAQPQAYVKINTTNGYDIYLTTHKDILTVTAPDVLCDGVISGLTVGSESITPEKGFSERGNTVVTLNEAEFTEELRDLFDDDKTVFNQKMEVHSGTGSIDISDFDKFAVSYIQSLDNDSVKYKIIATTTQVFSSTNIFTKATTELFTSFNSDDVLTEIEVLDTSSFELVEHDAHWEDSPNEEVGYLTFVGQDANGNDVTEYIKYWSKDSTKFYGDPSNDGKLQRGCFGSGRVTATGTSDSDTATQVTECIYIDLACGKMIIALLTGELYGQLGKTLPDGWHAGIDSSLVNIDSIEKIGFDLWNPDDDSGFHFYIFDPDETDAKSYIAREILRVSSLAFLTDVNGEMKAKRYAQIINGASTVTVLENNDVLNKPNFSRSSTDVRNIFPTRWDYRKQSGFIRNELIVDLDSQERNGVISRAENIDLKAVRNNQIEVTQLLKTVTDGIRTRLANPSIKPSIQANFRRTLNLECMDVIGLSLEGFSDYESTGDINRPFEIQQIQHDIIKRTTSMKLYGATAKADNIDIDSSSGTAVINDTDWLAIEDYLTGSFTNSSGVITLTSDCDLGTSADIGETKYYKHTGSQLDLNGYTLNIFGTVILNCDVIDIVNSTINGVGTGTEGGLGQTTDTVSPTIIGGGGYFGNYDSAEETAYVHEIQAGGGGSPSNGWLVRVPRSDENKFEPTTASIDNFIISVDQDGNLSGVPDTLAGNAGSGGMITKYFDTYLAPSETIAAGADGTNGGAGLLILTNNLIANTSSVIDLSGADATDLPDIESTGFFGNTNIAGGRSGLGWGGCLCVLVKNRANPLASNTDGIFVSKVGEINNITGYDEVITPNETTPQYIELNVTDNVLTPFYYSQSLANISGVDFAGSAFLSKYIGEAEEVTAQVGRDPIAPVEAPQSIELTANLDVPSTPDGNQITVTCNSVAPLDDNYSYTKFTYRNANEDAYYDTAYAVSNESSFMVTGNGKTYTVKAQSVSKQGVLGGFITKNITVKNVLTEPAIEPEVTPQRVSGLRLKNSIANNIQDKFKSGNAEFLWNAVSKNNSVNFGDEGLLGASSGGYDAWFKDYQVNIYDESQQLLRTEFTKTEAYTYTLEKNKTDNAGREFFIQVLSRGQNNQVSEGVLFKVENPQPEAVTGLSAKPSYNSIQVDFVSPSDIDYKGVNMRYRKVGLAWSALLFVAGTSCNVAELESGQEYEIELTSVDEFGTGASTSITSTTTTIEAEEIDGLSNWATELDPVNTAFLTANMEGESISSALLGSGSVTNSKLGALAVEAENLAGSSVTSTKIANLAVGTAAIADLAVTDAKIQSLTATKIDAGQVNVAVDIGTGVQLDGANGTVKTTNSDYTVIMGTADGAWNQLPNPTTITNLDTSTSTQTFGVDTDGNTIIGNGDNSVLFNQTTNTIDFGSNVTIGTNADQTVTVGAGGDFATLNEALEHLSKIVPAYKLGGFTATINILSGTTIEEQIAVNGIDLSFISITSEDASVYVDATTFTGFVSGVNVPVSFVIIYNGGKSPIIDTVFRYNGSGSVLSIGGIAVVGTGSSATIANGAGFIYFDIGAALDGGNIYSYAGKFYNSGIGLKMVDGSNAVMQLTNFNDSDLAFSIHDSNATLTSSYARRCDTVFVAYSSKIIAEAIRTENSNIGFARHSHLDLSDAELIEYPVTGAYALKVEGSTVILFRADMTNTNAAASSKVLIDAYQSTIDATDSEMEIGSSNSATIELYSSTLNINGGSHYYASLSSGSIVRAADSTFFSFSIAINTLTADGIVYQ